MSSSCRMRCRKHRPCFVSDPFPPRRPCRRHRHGRRSSRLQPVCRQTDQARKRPRRSALAQGVFPAPRSRYRCGQSPHRQALPARLHGSSWYPSVSHVRYTSICRSRCRLTGQPSLCFPGQEIGNIEETPGRVEDLGSVLAQPEQFWRLHLGRDRAANIGQDRVRRGVDPLRLFFCAMIHPDDDVALWIIRRYRQRHPPGPQHNQRASGVNADAGHFRPGGCPQP